MNIQNVSGWLPTVARINLYNNEYREYESRTSSRNVVIQTVNSAQCNESTVASNLHGDAAWVVLVHTNALLTTWCHVTGANNDTM